MRCPPGPTFTVMPGEGAVCPATVMQGVEYVKRLVRLIVPLTSTPLSASAVLPLALQSIQMETAA